MSAGQNKPLDKDGNLIIEKLLLDRGIDTDEKVQKFLYPSVDDFTPPRALHGIEDGANKIREHIKKGSKILIYGDYDCDGIGAAAILYLALKDMGAATDAFIPVRTEDGYGLSIDGITRVFATFAPQLIITVDCGISSHIEVDYIKSLGADVIVTDHHEPQSILPDCIIINPKLQKNYPELCGAGVALKLVEELKGPEYAFKFLDICAISTIADLVPLTSDNRIIASLGIKMLSKNLRPGIKALLKVAGHRPDEKITSYDVAFRIAPRLNASGRLSTAEKSFNLLVETDPYLLSLIADELEAENKARQELCAATIEEAKSLLDEYDILNNRVIVLYKSDWEGGVIGIAAAKITQEYHRPVILLSEKGGVWKGSCRSISGVNIHDILEHCKDLLCGFGGHSMAAGLSVLQENLPKFIAKCNEYTAAAFDERLFVPKNRYDAEISLKEIGFKFVEALERFEPFGTDNPRPIFMEKHKATAFARIKRHNHIKLNISRVTSMLAFNSAEYLGILCSDMEKKLYFTIEKEIFNNRELVKCYLKTIEITDFSSNGGDFLAYAESHLPYPAKTYKKPAFIPSSLYGHLIIVFSEESFKNMISKYPSYLRYYGIISGINPLNTLLFAPQGEISGVENYGKIDVYDTPSPSFSRYLQSTASGSIAIHNNPPAFSSLTYVPIDELRDTYTYLRAYAHTKAYDEDTAYNLLKAKGYTQSKHKFLFSYYIFVELGLIVCNKNDIIYVKSEKVELAASEIYAVMVKYARNTA